MPPAAPAAAAADAAAPFTGLGGAAAAERLEADALPALFRFPTVILLVAVAFGVHMPDLVADWMPREYAQAHYALAAEWSAVWGVEVPNLLGSGVLPDVHKGVVWNKGLEAQGVHAALSTLALAALAAALVLNLLLARRMHNVLAVALAAVLLFVDAHMIQPRVAAVGVHLAAGDELALGRIPAALRGLKVWHLSQQALLLMVGVLQLYTYSVWVGYAEPPQPPAAAKAKHE